MLRRFPPRAPPPVHPGPPRDSAASSRVLPRICPSAQRSQLSADQRTGRVILTVLNDYLLSVFLGIVEGVTEFLPVSSSAHLRICEALLGINLSDGYWKM